MSNDVSWGGRKTRDCWMSIQWYTLIYRNLASFSYTSPAPLPFCSYSGCCIRFFSNITWEYGTLLYRPSHIRRLVVFLLLHLMWMWCFLQKKHLMSLSLLTNQYIFEVHIASTVHNCHLHTKPIASSPASSWHGLNNLNLTSRMFNKKNVSFFSEHISILIFNSIDSLIHTTYYLFRIYNIWYM